MNLAHGEVKKYFGEYKRLRNKKDIKNKIDDRRNYLK